jgi:hypothetical protein
VTKISAADLAMARRFGPDQVKWGDTLIAVQGHWLYVTKLSRDPDELDEGIAKPEPLQQVSNWAKVLAKGDRVGKPRQCSRKVLKRFNIPRCIADSFEIGDVVLIPDKFNDFIKRSSVGTNEFFVDESVPICKFTEP